MSGGDVGIGQESLRDVPGGTQGRLRRGVAGHPAVETPRPHRWALVLLLGGAAWTVLPDLFDAGVVKRAATALLTAVTVVPLLAWAGRDAVHEWFTSTGARLFVAVTALSLIGATGHLAEAAVTDRLLTFGLVHAAAALGVLAAERDPGGLGRAVRWTTLPVALVAWAQALGWETALNGFDPASGAAPEVVGLSGNSTRAGALLALGVLAWCVRLTHRDDPTAADDEPGPASPRPLSADLLPAVALALGSGALVLTRARGARVAAAAGLVALLVVVARRARRPDAPPLKRALLAVVAGVLLAGLVGGVDALLARKLDGDGPVLTGEDLTANVRLALAEGTLSLVADAPLGGVGLGRFRAEFPPHRDPLEAAMPGLEGAATEAHHPHNEFLLAVAEGGLPAALLLLIAVVLTLRRAARLASAPPAAGGGADGLLALLLVVAGTVLACLQDAWTDVATALPVFAAVGVAWAARPDEARRYVAGGALATAGAALLAVGLAVLAWPRLDAHLSLRSFYLRAEDAGGVILEDSFAALLHAGEAGAGDVDIQRMLLTYGTMYAPRAPDQDGKVAAIQAVDRARERLEVLAPHGE